MSVSSPDNPQPGGPRRAATPDQTRADYLMHGANGHDPTSRKQYVRSRKWIPYVRGRVDSVPDWSRCSPADPNIKLVEADQKRLEEIGFHACLAKFSGKRCVHVTSINAYRSHDLHRQTTTASRIEIFHVRCGVPSLPRTSIRSRRWSCLTEEGQWRLRLKTGSRTEAYINVHFFVENRDSFQNDLLCWFRSYVPPDPRSPRPSVRPEVVVYRVADPGALCSGYAGILLLPNIASGLARHLHFNLLTKDEIASLDLHNSYRVEHSQSLWQGEINVHVSVPANHQVTLKVNLIIEGTEHYALQNEQKFPAVLIDPRFEGVTSSRLRPSVPIKPPPRSPLTRPRTSGLPPSAPQPNHRSSARPIKFGTGGPSNRVDYEPKYEPKSAWSDSENSSSRIRLPILKVLKQKKWPPNASVKKIKTSPRAKAPLKSLTGPPTRRPRSPTSKTPEILPLVPQIKGFDFPEATTPYQSKSPPVSHSLLGPSICSTKSGSTTRTSSRVVPRRSRPPASLFGNPSIKDEGRQRLPPLGQWPEFPRVITPQKSDSTQGPVIRKCRVSKPTVVHPCKPYAVGETATLHI